MNFINWMYLPYMLPFLVAGIFALILALYAWRRRFLAGAVTLSVMALVVSVWVLGYAFEIGSIELSGKVFWGKVQYLGIVAAPVTWLIFILQFRGYTRWVTWPRILAMCVIPAITVLLVWTTARHGLMWQQVSLDPTGPFPALTVEYGGWFWVHWAYSTLLVMLGIVLMIDLLLRSVHIYRWQAGLLVAAAFAPWLANAVYIFGLVPIPNLDLTPLAFVFTGAVFTWSLLHFRLLDLKPVARRTMVDVMSDGVFVLDTAGRIIDINRAAQKIIGLDESDAVGRTGTGVLSQWPQLLAHVRKTVDNESIEIALPDSAGNTRHYDVRITPLFNNGGELSGRIVAMRDISDRKQMEMALSEARDAVVQASRFKSELLARVSHELRTPIGAILGYVELLQIGAYGPVVADQVDVMNKVIENTGYLTQLVNELLEQSQFDEGKIRLNPQPFVVADLVSRVQAKMSVLAQAKNLEFSTQISPDVPTEMVGDEIRLQQILINLVNNAIKFTEHGEVALQIYLPQPDTWAIRVSDTGPGISAQAQTHIFSPFWQVDGSITRRHGGAGLGLSIVKNLVTLMGGQIQVESQMGQGTVFIVTFPLAPFLDIELALSEISVPHQPSI
ncbi:MAG: PAS domain-containing protein [Chloroflexi bacterium]|nr:MAG: PAS domain-containing protein [Chloroflexota bacterium]